MPKSESSQYSCDVKLTQAVLNHKNVSMLPRGELFISPNFLDYYFKELVGAYELQLLSVGRSLGLQVIGVDLNKEVSLAFLKDGRFGVLENFFSVGCLNGPITHLVHSKGFLQAMDSLKNDPLVFLQIAEKTRKGLEEKMNFIAQNSFKAIALTDDIAGNGGLFFSPHQFENYVLPTYREIVKILKVHDFYAFFHSDGDITTILGFLIEAGFDCLNCIDAQAGMDLYKIRDKLGVRMCLMGHLDIVTWDKRRIGMEIERAEKEFSRGGLILGSSTGISLETFNKNIFILYPELMGSEIFKKFHGGQWEPS